jgi:hypothetical protein
MSKEFGNPRLQCINSWIIAIDIIANCSASDCLAHAIGRSGDGI